MISLSFFTFLVAVNASSKSINSSCSTLTTLSFDKNNKSDSSSEPIACSVLPDKIWARPIQENMRRRIFEKSLLSPGQVSSENISTTTEIFCRNSLISFTIVSASSFLPSCKYDLASKSWISHLKANNFPRTSPVSSSATSLDPNCCSAVSIT